MELRKIRKEKGYTLQQVSQALGVTKQCISNWESGIRPIKIEMLKKLAQVFNMPLAVFVVALYGNEEKAAAN